MSYARYEHYNPENLLIKLEREKFVKPSPGSLVGSYFLNWQNMKEFHYIPTLHLEALSKVA